MKNNKKTNKTKKNMEVLLIDYRYLSHDGFNPKPGVARLANISDSKQ